MGEGVVEFEAEVEASGREEVEGPGRRVEEPEKEAEAEEEDGRAEEEQDAIDLSWFLLLCERKWSQRPKTVGAGVLSSYKSDEGRYGGASMFAGSPL